MRVKYSWGENMDVTIKSILDKFPERKVLLPLQGNRSDWPYHVTMCNLQFKDIWNRLTWSDMASSLAIIYRMNCIPTDYTTIKTYMQELFALNFFGLNPMRYQGFTEYKDNRLSSYTDQLKYVLNPSEFVLWDEPVINMMSGTVVNIYNESLDMISRKAFNTRPVFGDRMNELYGNSIAIETDNGIRVYYCGLMKNSFLKYKVGEQVKAGQIIGKVGCSGALSKRPFLHIEVAYRFAPETGNKTADSFKLNQISVPLINFEPFYEMPLWTDYRDTQEGIERMYVKDIKYIFNPGHFMRAGSLIKKTSNK